MKHHGVFERGLSKVRSALSIPSKAKCAVSIPDFELLNIDSDHSDEESTTMGKSNKFDYTNRASGGAKLGGIIGRDAEKEADKVIKDAEKQSAKTRKLSISSSTTDHSGIVAHPLDIKAPSKQLGDEGACAMATGLEAALLKGANFSAVLLEDLSLSDNGVTTATLARLAPVIHAACYHLKTLNLADNNITVETDQQAVEWESFLQSFSDCRKLRRVDLSGNANLGPRALEVFARVYCKEPHVTPVPAGGNDSVYSLSLSDVDEELESPLSASFSSDKMARAGILPRRRGLRGTPYITLTNIGLTDAGALWLSYVLEEHYYPVQLTDSVNSVTATSTIRVYAQDSNCKGMDWDETEPALGKDGLQLLKKTETVRSQTLLENGGVEGFSMYDSGELPHARTGDRRASMRSITSADGGEHELSEMESLRKKLQRHIIAATGATQVELWRASLRMAVSSTVLSGIGPSARDQMTFYTGPPLFHLAQSGDQASQPATLTRNGKNKQQPVSGDTVSIFSHPQGGARQGTYAQTLTLDTSAAAGEPDMAITEVTNSLTTPKVMILKPHRKGTFSDGSDLQTVNQKLDRLLVRDNNPHRYVRWQQKRIEARGGQSAFRNPAVPSHLPSDVMDQIVEGTISEREAEMLTRKQRRGACAWGQDRSNFEVRESWRRLPDSSQVVSLLERIGCQAYQAE